MIVKTLEVGSFAANCYIVGSEKTGDGMIIDPGSEASEILKTANDLKLKTALIVLTHSHVDHIGAVKKVKEATGAGLAMHTEEAKAYQGQARLRGLLNFYTSALPAPDRLLKGGDSIDIGDLHFLVLHTPGHSPGGICLYSPGVVFTGDTLFNYGIGRTDFPGGSHRQLLDSIHTKLMVLPDETVVYPGHGPHSTIGAERKGNPFLRGI